jgi:multidrug efflux pump subunit AcrB
VALGVDRFPAVDLPSVFVRTTLPGASPEEVEVLVSQVVEEAVNRVEGLDELRSVSGPGSSIVIATFKLERDIDSATQDVRDRSTRRRRTSAIAWRRSSPGCRATRPPPSSASRTATGRPS